MANGWSVGMRHGERGFTDNLISLLAVQVLVDELDGHGALAHGTLDLPRDHHAHPGQQLHEPSRYR